MKWNDCFQWILTRSIKSFVSESLLKLSLPYIIYVQNFDFVVVNFGGWMFQSFKPCTSPHVCKSKADGGNVAEPMDTEALSGPPKQSKHMAKKERRMAKKNASKVNVIEFSHLIFCGIFFTCYFAGKLLLQWLRTWLTCKDGACKMMLQHSIV